MHDPVPDHIGVAQAVVERRAQLRRIDAVTRRLQLPRHEHAVVLVQQRELQAAGTGVDDENSHWGLLEAG